MPPIKTPKVQSPAQRLSAEQTKTLLAVLRARFDQKMHRHRGLAWADVQAKLEAHPEKCWSLHEMETTGGEPDVVNRNSNTGEFTFYDCSAETPKGRRNLCYDPEALHSRIQHKPKDSAVAVASAMGINLLTEEDIELFRNWASSIPKPPAGSKHLRISENLAPRFFCDRRYNTVFLYHNGAEIVLLLQGLPRLLNHLNPTGQGTACTDPDARELMKVRLAVRMAESQTVPRQKTVPYTTLQVPVCRSPSCANHPIPGN
jgi:hypothetical protein